MLSSKFHLGFVALLLAAVGLVDLSDPSFDLQLEAERQAGVAVAICGGPNHEAGAWSALDPSCVEANRKDGTPYVAWQEGPGGVYQGEIVFRRDGVAHAWHLVDERDLGGPLTVRMCREGEAEDCAPARCVDACDGDYLAVRNRVPSPGS